MLGLIVLLSHSQAFIYITSMDQLPRWEIGADILNLMDQEDHLGYVKKDSEMKSRLNVKEYHNHLMGAGGRILI